MDTQELFKRKALLWAGQFENCCYLDSNNYIDKYGSYDALIAAGNLKTLSSTVGSAFSKLKSFYTDNRSWMFGLLTYELKDETESLKSKNPDSLDFPALFFFIPEYLIAFKNGNIEVILGSVEILKDIEKVIPDEHSESLNELCIQQRINRKSYLDALTEIRTHINRGDIYEVTFCQEFFAKNAQIDPLSTFERLKELSPTPFSGYMKIGEKYILSASPERFLSKRGRTLISQPIKGTARRG
ncbi:MAG: aminodeoxychorismate synthase component I, partial [Chryseobacterium sp.]